MTPLATREDRVRISRPGHAPKLSTRPGPGGPRSRANLPSHRAARR